MVGHHNAKLTHLTHSLSLLVSLALSLSLYLNSTLSRHCCNFSLLPPLLVRLSICCLYIYMYSVVWVTVGLLPLWHDLKNT